MTLACRIAYLVQGLGTGGLERVVLHLAGGMVRRGHQVTICCYNRRGELARAAEEEGAAVALLPRKLGVDWGYIPRLAGWLRQRGVDVLHMHNETALFYGTTAGILAKVGCLIYTEHDGVFPRSWRARWCNRFLVRRLTHAVAVSDAVRQLWCREDGIDPSLVKVVPNGVPAEARARQAARYEVAGRLRIGSVGRLSHEKGADVLLEAFGLVRLELPECELILVGDGRERPHLEALAAQKGMTGQVRFSGEREDVPALLKDFDMFVLPSRSEGLPLALLEAMAAGLPIVATAVGGVPEAIADNRTGLLVPPLNPQAMGDAILRLAQDAGLRARLGTAANQEFGRRYRLSQMVDAYEGLMA